MDWTDIQITVPTGEVDAAAAIAQMAVPYGIYIEDYSDLVEQVPRIAHVDLIDEELLGRPRDRAVIHLYISPDENPAEAVAWLAGRLEEAGISHAVTTGSIEEEEWATAWKDYYHPTPIGKRLVVCPTWEDHTPAQGQLVLRLDPGMAFGTGTHHTTRLCCTLLEETVSPGCRLLDMGTGSGILSIAALLLGASQAVGVDIDPVAVRTAGENAALNGFGPGREAGAGDDLTGSDKPAEKESRLGPERFIALCGDLIHDERLAERLGSGFDLIAANIVADAIIALAPVFPKKLKPGGKVICSGIILPRREEVVAALERAGLSVLRAEEREGWCALLAALPDGGTG